MARLNDRLARLEAEDGAGEMFWAWRKEGETAAQAEARFRNANPEAVGHPVTVIGWQEEAAAV